MRSRVDHRLRQGRRGKQAKRMSRRSHRSRHLSPRAAGSNRGLATTLTCSSTRRISDGESTPFDSAVGPSADVRRAMLKGSRLGQVRFCDSWQGAAADCGRSEGLRRNRLQDVRYHRRSRYDHPGEAARYHADFRDGWAHLEPEEERSSEDATSSCTSPASRPSSSAYTPICSATRTA
jgi:hypothetical protein